MPIGGFLDQLPSALFIAAHLIFLGFGLWVIRQATEQRARYSPAFWLYVTSQVVFLAFFAGLTTLKMSVLVEQTLIFAMLLWVITAKERRSIAGEMSVEAHTPA